MNSSSTNSRSTLAVWPRRSFLTSTAAAAVAIGAMPPRAIAADDVADIDAHVHVWTPDTEKYPLDSSFKKSDMQPASFTPSELFAFTKPVGVKRIVLIQMSFYKFDNRYMLDAIEQFPGVFSGVAIVDENKAGLQETMKSMGDKGVRGYRLYTTREAAEKWSSSAAMKEMWKNAADLGQAMCLLANPDSLPAIDRMCESFPNTRVVIDHFARIGMDGTVRSTDLENLCRLSKYPHLYVKTSAFYALGKKQPPYTDLGEMIRQLNKAFGAQRLMWASDCPYQVQGIHTYNDSIALIRERLAFLTESDKQAILRKTAEKVFFS